MFPCTSLTKRINSVQGQIVFSSERTVCLSRNLFLPDFSYLVVREFGPVLFLWGFNRAPNVLPYLSSQYSSNSRTGNIKFCTKELSRTAMGKLIADDLDLILRKFSHSMRGSSPQTFWVFATSVLIPRSCSLSVPHILHVGFMRTQQKMRRIAAIWIVASMPNQERKRILFSCCVVRNSTGTCSTRGKLKYSITSFGFGSQPRPTGIRILDVYLAPKSLHVKVSDRRQRFAKIGHVKGRFCVL